METTDQYLAEVQAKREAFALRLQVIIASDLSPRMKTLRIKGVTRDIIALKNELRAVIKGAESRSEGAEL